ncbi:barstar family protein [Parapusillimonas granuli]|uniref:Barstar family protein n=1 Tax=Parapusillimonas granuli TaxID=380911 RepID=A0A853G382_9BURK|nr:barstar family protein [Parapusillimonas granuli]MBB5215152.1 RNAse (barnase) inhibitor barstar [Parapusillimonas granuli]MEB2401459.1 barstar family protein [Alcaligenaceae bacterium]NYT49470.1 barstar family protein [Parapusillimonas granuli]
MSQAQSLQSKLQKGGLIDVSAVSQAEALDAAKAAGMTALVVDCDRARSRSAVLRAVVKAVDFPEFFGGNLDALYDCLCDTVLDHKQGLFLWFDNLHSGDPALAEDSEAILAVCEDVVEFASNNDRHFTYGVVHAGKHPDPEPGVEPTPYSGGDA